MISTCSKVNPLFARHTLRTKYNIPRLMCKVARGHLRLRKGQVSFKLSSTIWAFKAEKGSDFIAAHKPDPSSQHQVAENTRHLPRVLWRAIAAKVVMEIVIFLCHPSLIN